MGNDLERVQRMEILTGSSEGAVNRELRRLSKAGLLAAASPVVRAGQGYAVKVIRIAEPRRRIRWGLVTAGALGGLTLLALVGFLLVKLVGAVAAMVAALMPFALLVLALLALAGLGGGGTNIVQSIVIKR